MKKEVFAGLSSILFPMGLYALPSPTLGSYQRSYLRASTSNKHQPLLQSGYTLSVKPPKQIPLHASELELITAQTFKELIIIDAAVPDKHLLRNQLRPGVDVVELNDKQDGLKQLEKLLNQYQELQAVHIVSHADEGRVQLGGSWLSTDIIKSRVEFFSSINHAIKDGGDLLFYGCNLAAGESGAEFLDIIKSNTHVDIAASDDATGNLKQGGDWDLEIQYGEIRSDKLFSSIALKDFSSVLAITDGSGGTIDLGGFPGGAGNYYSTNTYSNVSGSGFNLRISADTSGGRELGGTQYGYMGFNMYGDSGTKKIYIDFQGGQTFDATSIYIYNGQSATKAFKITSNQGDSYTSTGIPDSGSVTASLTGFTGITQLTIENNDGSDMLYLRLDDLTIANAQNPNSAPTISIDNAALAYTENGSAIQIDSAGTVSDADGDADWNGGTLEVQITLNAEGTDTTSISDTDGDGTAITISGTNIFANGTDIGDLSASGGTVTGATKLTITFDADATNANVQEVLQSIRFVSSSENPGTSRTVTFTATDKNAGSNSDTRTISITRVNDEPTLTATGSNPTFTEGGAAASLFSSASASTIEGGQDIQALTMTVTNLADGSNERLNVDGTAIVLTHGTSGTTASNSLSYSVSVVGSTATVSLTGGTLSTAATQTLVNAISYQNNSNTPNTSNRVVTITSMQDDGGTANGGDDTTALSIASTVTVVQVNDEPTLTATGSNPTFTEGGSAASLFSGTSVSTVESGQTIKAMTLTITNVSNGINERLNADGSTIILTHGTSGTTATNSLSYVVTVVGSTATVSLSGGTMSTAATQTMVNALSYQNTSNDPNTSNRVVTITSLQDSGGTANGGDDTTALAVASTVTVVGVNDEPTLTATGSNPTFTEGGSAASLYSSANASTIESGQTIQALTMTITNLADGSNERLNVDGTTIVLTHGTSGTTASNSLSYSVSVVGSTATVSLTGGTLSTAATQTLVNAISYQNNSNTPNTSNRVATITAMQDSGGTANGGDNTVALAIASTVTVVQINDEPTLSATGSNPTFTEGGSAASLFSGTSVSTVESGQTLSAMTLTVTNVNDGSNEILNADGTAIALTNANSGTTATNSLSYSVSVSGSTATVSFSGGTMSTAATQTLVNALSYQNNSDDPNTSNRVVTITSLQDSGGTANGGDDTAALAVASTVTMVGVNDEPTLTATGSNPTFTEGGSAASLYSSASASTIESGQTIAALTLTVTNLSDGTDEILNADGTAIVLTHGTSGTTASNSLSYSVSVVGSTATVSLTGGTMSTAATQTLVDALSYQNNNGSLTVGNRVVTLTAIQDSGGTANGGDNTAALSIASTVNVVSVNQEPTLSATGSDPSFTEGGSAAGLFSSTSISTVESGQTILALTLEITNVNDGNNEILNADGSAIALTDSNSGTTTDNSLTYNVSVSGTTATVSITSGGFSTANTQTLVDNLSYQNNSQAPNTSNRVVTITALQDNGGTANGGDDTAALSVDSTVTVITVNDEPMLSATGDNPTFTENGAAANPYSGTSVSTVESGQTLIMLTLTISNINDGSDEILNIDGSAIALTDSNSGTTTDNSLSYNVSVAGTTATVTLSGGTLSTAAMQTLVDELSYQNNNDTPNTSNRVITLTGLQDSGGTANGGDDTSALSVVSTISVVEASDPPVITEGADEPVTMSEDGAPTAFSLTLNATDVDNTGSQLTWSISTQAANGTATASGTGLSKAIGYTPNANFNGSDSFVVRVSDGSGNDTITINVTVQAVNDAPSISGTPQTSVTAGSAYSFTPTISDVDSGDSHVFSIASLPSWASFNTTNGTLSGTPSSSNVGNHTIDISVTDSGNASDALATFTITVADNSTDSDGDGVSDYQEGLDGTDPDDPDDYLDTTAPELSTPDDLVIDASGLFTTVTLRQLLGLNSSASNSQVTSALNTIASDNIDGDACCAPSVRGMSNNILLLPPGRNSITWRATDNKGNTGRATQIVNVRPLVSLSKDQIGVEGTALQFRIILNGASPFYPLQIPYVIDSSSTAGSNDHDLVAGNASIEEGQQSVTITVNLTQDNTTENDETLLVNLDDRTTAAQDLADGYDENNPNIYDINSGAKTQHSITITESNVAPSVSLQIQQNANNTLQVTRNGGAITITANATDPNPDDTLQYDWSNSDTALQDTDGDTSDNTFVINPSNLSTGKYKVRVTVTDTDQAFDTDKLYFLIVNALPELSDSNDSDNDGIDDLTEGLGDSDNDGIPDYLDNITASNVLPEVATETNAYLLECDPGIRCRLGQFSFAGSTGGARLDEDDLGSDSGIDEDTEYTYSNGIFDFEMHELPIAGRSVKIVIPQTAAIPENAVYRKYQNGQWVTFTEDANNALHSALGEAGYCPPPDDESWEAGLIEGYFCVQLTIEDGGANDADGMADKAIEDPGGVATAIAQPPADVIVRSQGGGAMYGLLLLSLLSLLYSRSKRMHKRLLSGLVLWLLCQSGHAADFTEVDDAQKFYATLSFYQASGSQTGNDLTTGVSNAGIDITLNTYEVDRSAFQIQFGYRYHQYMAVQLGYLDLGDVDVDFTVATNDTDTLSTALGNHYPISSNGWVLSNRFEFALNNHFTTSIDAGIYNWDSEIDLDGLNITPSIEEDTDLLLGVNLDYRITPRSTVGFSVQRVFFAEQTVDLWGGNISFSF